jgi:hypothetical protein
MASFFNSLSKLEYKLNKNGAAKSVRQKKWKKIKDKKK